MKGKLGSNVPMQPSIPKMPSNTSNALEALDSVNETQFNVLDSISRQAAKDMIKNHKSDFSTEKDYRTAKACVNAVPPAEPERIKSKWALHTYIPHNNFCLACRNDSPYNKRWDFCPKCGADMRER